MCDILEEFKQECIKEGIDIGEKRGEAKQLINTVKKFNDSGMAVDACFAILQKTKEDYLQALELVGMSK